ncbi:MAG: hypothetical protein VYD08_07615 [Pseudomonadota bacterium]|nr:hypothetical protein [Pseudomonadota bacterium]
MNLNVFTTTTAVVSDLNSSEKDALLKATGYPFATTNDNGYMVIDTEELNTMLSDDPDFTEGQEIKDTLTGFGLNLDNIDRVEII